VRLAATTHALTATAEVPQAERGADPGVAAALLGEADRPGPDRGIRDRVHHREPQERAPALRALHGEGLPDLADSAQRRDRGTRRSAATAASPPPQPELIRPGARRPRRSRRAKGRRKGGRRGGGGRPGPGRGRKGGAP